jgi:hypothetical protein
MKKKKTPEIVSRTLNSPSGLLLVRCEMCTDLWCVLCRVHYADCGCPGVLMDDGEDSDTICFECDYKWDSSLDYNDTTCPVCGASGEGLPEGKPLVEVLDLGDVPPIAL